MIIIDDHNLPQQLEAMEIVNRVGQRNITHAIHDVDGTHSLIRDWPPVMSICLHHVLQNGVPPDFDSEANKRWLIENAGARPLPETDRYCVEAAGFSALTQMEWAIRRGLQLGTVKIPNYQPTERDIRINDSIIEAIWRGKEVFDEIDEASAIRHFLDKYVPRLFRLYEEVLCGANRDRNLAAARRNPVAWRVPGSLEFLKELHEKDVKNYFVTGAVITMGTDGKPGGMYEEAVALEYGIGHGEMVEAIVGSTWNKKVTKIEAMQSLIDDLGIQKKNVLVVGDGRAEIHAAVLMGAVAMSCLPEDAKRKREIHRGLGTNYIVSDYAAPSFHKLFFKQPKV